MEPGAEVAGRCRARRSRARTVKPSCRSRANVRRSAMPAIKRPACGGPCGDDSSQSLDRHEWTSGGGTHASWPASGHSVGKCASCQLQGGVAVSAVSLHRCSRCRQDEVSKWDTHTGARRGEHLYARACSPRVPTLPSAGNAFVRGRFARVDIDRIPREASRPRPRKPLNPGALVLDSGLSTATWWGNARVSD